jgi:vacuolar-type H+-ATPase subunit H
MPVNRIVTLLTPVFTALAAVGSGYLARHAGITFSPAELTAIEIAASTAALTSSLKWLHGHQKFEADLRHLEELAKAGILKAEQIDPAIKVQADQLLKAAETKAHEILSIAERQTEVKAAALANKEQVLAAREQVVTQHENRLKAIVGEVRKDPFLVIPDDADVTPQAQVVPSDDIDTQVATPADQAQPEVAVNPAPPTPSPQQQQV